MPRFRFGGIVVMILIGVAMFSPAHSSDPDTIYVNSSCVDDPVGVTSYPTLAMAYDAANPGDTIIARSGSFSERLTLSKPLTIDASGGPVVIGQYPESQEDLAYHWAPVHYQDVNKGDFYGRADYITSIDREGTWDMRLNWRTSEGGTFLSYDLNAWIYYSVVSTRSHHYITYIAYHPVDWCHGLICEPDENNDGEGALFIIKRDGTQWGKLEAAITQYHGCLHAYFPTDTPLELGCNLEDIDQGVCWITRSGDGRAMTSQESEGHGFGFWPAYSFGEGDGIVYVPSRDTAGIPPATIPDGQLAEVPYRLVDIHAPGGLWEHRYDSKVFNPSTDYFEMVGGHGNPPWQFNAFYRYNCGLCVPGVWTHDPALMAQYYFKLKDASVEPWEYFNREYVRNPYRNDMAILTLENAKALYCDPQMSLQHWTQNHNGSCPPSDRRYPCE